MRLKRRIASITVASVLGMGGVGIGIVTSAAPAMADDGCVGPSAPVGTLGTSGGWVVQCQDGFFGPQWYPLYPIPGGPVGGGRHQPLQP
jgi:hypothetical protein